MTFRRTLRALGGLGLLVLALVVVRAAGTGTLAAPPASSTDALGNWIDQAGPATAAMSLVRLVTEGVLWYLVAVAAVVVVADLTRSASGLRFASLVAAPVPDRVVRVALGITLATAGQQAPPSGGDLAAGPTATATATMVALDGDDASGAVPTMERLPDDGDRAAVATGGPVQELSADGDTARATPWPGDDAAGDASPTPVDTPSTQPSSVDPAERSTWTVTEGESFWVIAGEVLSEQLGRPASDADIVPYWHALVDANQHRLVDPDNPDLILPGQVMELPIPAPAAS